MILAVIAACEVAFWVFLVTGLAVRYTLRRPRLGATLLIAAPAVDVVLLGATAWSLHRGDSIEVGHALAAIYIGFSVAYGHRLIGWLDTRFAHRFDGGPAPTRTVGAAYARECWADVARTALAGAIASALTASLTWMASPGTDTRSLTQNYRWMAAIFIIDLLWAISYTIWPRKEESSAARSGDAEPT